MRFVNAWHIEIVLTAAEKKVSQMFFFFCDYIFIVI